MKNLIEELHNLDEYEYKVSPDFSKRVMKEIKKSKNTSNISRVISLASFGAAACFAVVVFSNSNLLGRFGAKTESVDNANNIEMAYYDSLVGASAADNIQNDSKEDSIEFALDDYMLPQATTQFNSANDAIKDESIEKTEFDTLVKETLEVYRNDKQDFKEIVKILKDANIDVEEHDYILKAKATKEKVQELLKEYENITIEEKGEYVLIK